MYGRTESLKEVHNLINTKHRDHQVVQTSRFYPAGRTILCFYATCTRYANANSHTPAIHGLDMHAQNAQGEKTKQKGVFP